jgi:hypothetical protein
MSSEKVAVTFVVVAEVEQELLAGCIVVVSSTHRCLLPKTLGRRLSRLATRREYTTVLIRSPIHDFRLYLPRQRERGLRTEGRRSLRRRVRGQVAKGGCEEITDDREALLRFCDYSGRTLAALAHHQPD